MPNIWFTADTHFGHNRIIQYCNRPFTSHEEMDEVIISNFNYDCRKGDVIYHLGDVGWSTFDKKAGFLDRLNTKEVHLLLGNHDKEKEMRRLPWRSVHHFRSITIDNERITLFHYPMRSWSSRNHGGFQLYGHCHGNMPGIGRQMDVGVDTNGFRLWSWEEVRSRLKEISFDKFD